MILNWLTYNHVLERGRITHQASIIAGSNLLIAQHRDKLRYAAIRGCGYLPVLREFQAEDFVYLKRRNLDSVLQMAAKRPVYRVKDGLQCVCFLCNSGNKSCFRI